MICWFAEGRKADLHGIKYNSSVSCLQFHTHCGTATLDAHLAGSLTLQSLAGHLCKCCPAHRKCNCQVTLPSACSYLMPYAGLALTAIGMPAREPRDSVPSLAICWSSAFACEHNSTELQPQAKIAERPVMHGVITCALAVLVSVDKKLWYIGSVLSILCRYCSRISPALRSFLRRLACAARMAEHLVDVEKLFEHNCLLQN